MASRLKLDDAWIEEMLDSLTESRVLCAVSKDYARFDQVKDYVTSHAYFNRHRALLFERNHGLREFDRSRRQWQPVARQASGQFADVATGEIRSETEAMAHVDSVIRAVGTVFLYPYPEFDSEDPRSFTAFLRQWAGSHGDPFFVNNSVVILLCTTDSLITEHHLSRDVPVFQVPTSSDGERLTAVRYLADLYGAPLDEAKEQELAATLRGLEISDVQHVMNRAYCMRTGEFDLKATAEYAAERLSRNTLVQKVKPKPVVGRESELQELAEILSKREKANSILVGPAGVGKTAIVEGLAWIIQTREVPSCLLNTNTKIVSVSLGDLTANARLRGEFEGRLKRVLEEVKQSEGRIILFIDEIHTVMQADGGHGAIAAADILKPLLANGDIRVIGATTPEEFKKIEKDPALTRRFVKITVDEPTADEAVGILAGRKPDYEHYHGVAILDEALNAAVCLSQRYITARHLPDKAFDVLDRACVRAGSRDGESGNHEVSAEDVARVVAKHTGIPVSRLTAAESDRLLQMEAILAESVIGQPEAVAKTAQTIRRSRAGLRNPRKPVGVLLFVGPTGVGKTELARTLAGFLFNDPSRIVRIDMSEFSEPHTVSRLIGAPPGYVGYEEGGLLTEPVRRHPYSVVLLDEVEKAHPKVWDLLLQVFDEGRLADRAGRQVDFCNALVIMTSNLAGEELQAAIDESEQAHIVQTALRLAFKPEFINRLDEVIVFRTLSANDLRQILSLHVAELNVWLAQKSLSLSLDSEAEALVVREGFSPEYGARALKRAAERLLGTPLADGIHQGRFTAGDRLVAHVSDGAVVFEAAS